MNRKYNLKLDLQFRCNNSTMKFNQFDNNTSDFFMRITNGGNLVDIEKAIVVLAIIKPSGKVASQFVEVENGLVYADLKPSMKDEIGTYTAKAMLILEDERVVTESISYEVEEDKIFSLLNDTVEDTEDFTLLTDMLSRLSAIETSEEQRVINEAERILSEENRKIEEAKRVEAELIRQHEEADRAKYDATRESNENIRKQNESIRLANETNRIDEEAKRVEEEANRVEAEQLRKDNYNFMTEDEDRRRSEANSHKEAENLRAQAENTRVNEEAKRRTTEQARILAENTRVSNENTRKANETTRQTNETHRVEAETQRQNRYNSFIADAEANANNFENYTNSAKIKEEERKANELDRKSQEDRRVSNEVERISNENTRKANEKARQNNETTRQNIFENKVDEVDKKIVELNTTKDNFVSNINTKVDSKISEIDNVKSDMTNTVANKVNEVENRFNALTSKQQQDAEVIDARDGETSLKARLDRDIEKAKQVYVNVEGSHISTDSSSGYLKDIEILGNTIQSASNLADIRSVGDTVEGQELYEIPVVSYGKNLFNPLNNNTEYALIGGTNTKVTYKIEGGKLIIKSNPSVNSGWGWVEFKKIKVTPNKSYTIHPNATVVKGNACVFVYDGNNTKLFEISNVSKTFVPTTKHINIRLYVQTTTSYTDAEIHYKLQLEEGTQATPYEPYIEDKLTILSPTPLEKVGDVRDRIIEKDGVFGVEKNIKTIRLDSKSTWRTQTNKNEIKLFVNQEYLSNNISNRVILCDALTVNNGANQDDINGHNQILVHKHPSYSKNIYISKDFENVTLFTAWLDENPVNIKCVTETEPQFIPLPHSQQVKLRTFAGKTNISFLTEIEGMIKAQVPKSLGATVNTHTEQINNLNKELDRVKKLEESTVSTVTTESGFTTVEATSNGYFEDVKLEGKTLVNCLNVEPNVYTSPLHKSEIVNGYHKLTMLTDGDLMWDVSKTNDLNLFKPSTYYTFIVDVKTNTTQSTEPIRANTSLNCIFTNGGESNSYIALSTLNQTGVFVYRYKSEPNFTINNIKLKMANAKNGGVLEYRMIVLEGDHTQNPPSGYIEGLKSVGQDVDEVSVASVNENLFNGEFVIGSITDATGVDNNSATAYRSKNYIKVDSNETYYYGFDINQTFTSPNVYCYDENKNFISKISNVSNLNKFTTPTNCKYVKVRIFDISNFKDVSVTNAFISKKDYYTPHQSDKKRLLYYNEETQTWEKPILREWDSIEKYANGKYYYHQRSLEAVINGSEDWRANEAFSTGDYIACLSNSALSDKKQGVLNIISDKFNTKNCASIPVLEEGMWGEVGNSVLYMSISKSKLSTQDVEGFKKWLQANNVTVVYQLAQEKVYECTNIDLITYANETNYVVESGVLSPRTTLKVHNNISNVVSLLQKKVSLLESNVTSYMITQNRLMLASRYNADTVSFKVDVATLRNSFEYDNDLYELILNNILVGKDNYNREYIENLTRFYWMDFVISDEMYSTLFEIIEEQHNPKIEEETPLI